MTQENAKPPPHGSRLWRTFDRLLRPVELACLGVSCLFLLVVMVLISLDALMRYLFSNPLTFQFQLTESYLLVGLVMMGMAWSFRTGGYIRISGIAQFLPHSLLMALYRTGLLVSAGYVGALAWKGGEKFIGYYRSGEAMIGSIDWPLHLSWIWVPVGLGLLALRLLLIASGPVQMLDDAQHDTH